LTGRTTELIVGHEVERLGDGQAAIAGTLTHRLVDGLTGRRQHQHLLARAVRGGAQRLERMRLTRTRRRLQRLDEERPMWRWR